MSPGSNPAKLDFRPLFSSDELKDFNCGVEEMDSFIHEKLNDSISGGYCKAFVVLEENSVVAFYALNFDALILDEDDKEDLKSFNHVGVKGEYAELFWDKLHYPALEISYLAVLKGKRRQGIGRLILSEIYRKATTQDLAGCQFLTVEAYKRPSSPGREPYSAQGFYSKFGFSPVELPNPAKETVRMCLPLPVIQQPNTIQE